MNVFVQNKKAGHDYEYVKKFEVGMVLEGWEVKSLKMNNCSLKEAYIDEFHGELWIYGMHITKWKNGSPLFPMNETRPRKLLLSKAEFEFLIGRKQQKGFTIVPVDLHMSRKYIKMTIALARGVKEFEKREKEKKREIERDIRRENF